MSRRIRSAITSSGSRIKQRFAHPKRSRKPLFSISHRFFILISLIFIWFGADKTICFRRLFAGFLFFVAADSLFVFGSNEEQQSNQRPRRARRSDSDILLLSSFALLGFSSMLFLSPGTCAPKTGNFLRRYERDRPSKRKWLLREPSDDGRLGRPRHTHTTSAEKEEEK